MTSEAALPTLYAPWLRTVAGGPIAAETKATCDCCVMLPPKDNPSVAKPSDVLYFHPDTKCCAFQPDLPNFLAGRILSEMDTSMTAGRGALEKRIARRVAVKPSRVGSGVVFGLLYRATPGVFGRAPALRCHYLSSDGNCGVWKHRPGVCATWLCKHVRGAAGSDFWKLTDKLLRAVEWDLAYWCMAQLGVGLGELGEPTPPQPTPHVSELQGEIDWPHYRRLWGNWAGREVEFYQACDRLVETLTWRQVEERCGPRVAILAGLVRDAYKHLASPPIPERLRMANFRFVGLEANGFRVRAYSKYDPLLMPEALVRVLRYFDGRPTDEVLETIQTEQSTVLAPSLVRRMVDFGILESCDPDPGPLRVLS